MNVHIQYIFLFIYLLSLLLKLYFENLSDIYLRQDSLKKHSK